MKYDPLPSLTTKGWTDRETDMQSGRSNGGVAKRGGPKLAVQKVGLNGARLIDRPSENRQTYTKVSVTCTSV